MRDIRTDLTDRLKAIKHERETIENRLKELDHLEKTVGQMLRLEEVAYAKGQTNLFRQAANGKNSDLTEFVRKTMKTLKKMGNTSTVLEISEIAITKKFPIPGARPGQRIQGTLLALKKKGEAKSIGDGQWEYCGPD